MKTRIVLLVIFAAVVTFSFAFTSVKKEGKQVRPQAAQSSKGSEPVGGFEMEDSL